MPPLSHKEKSGRNWTRIHENEKSARDLRAFASIRGFFFIIWVSARFPGQSLFDG
jgi:hypothetical protein